MAVFLAAVAAGSDFADRDGVSVLRDFRFNVEQPSAIEATRADYFRGHSSILSGGEGSPRLSYLECG